MAAAEELPDTNVNLTIKDAKLSFYEKKYYALRKRCEHLQQSNEKLVNRIQHVKKLCRRFKSERRTLQTRLDEHGDNYREAQVALLFEDLQSDMPGKTLDMETEEDITVGKKPFAMSLLNPTTQESTAAIKSEESSFMPVHSGSMEGFDSVIKDEPDP